ncbi:MAG: 30S ribosomal protein S17 [Candidatus Coatesbacteria bacterium]|nr:MAG: 30S ribosomal protein S17 [Candidatus Coatesbacteria bacterium]
MAATDYNEAPARNRRKVMQGRVVSDANAKSIIVEVVRRKRHPLFKKMVKRSKRFMAHDEKDECRVGDTVRIMETRPQSKRKRWRLIEIVERAE